MPSTISSKCPANAGKSGSTLSADFWGGRLDGVSGTLGFPQERRVSLMLVTMLIAAVSVNRTLLRRYLGGCAFALAFRREGFASFDVSYIAAATLPPSRRCRVNGALLDELLPVTGLAPLLQTNFKSGTLRKTLRYGAKAKSHRATCTMDVLPLHHLLWN